MEKKVIEDRSLTEKLKLCEIRNQFLEKEYEKLLEENKQLRGLVFLDQLTGLYNRRGFDMLLNKESSKIDGLDGFDKREKHKYLFSLAMFDIDGFKKINDSYGHNAGDMVLKGIGSIIKTRLRHPVEGYDTAARVSGDEFTVIFPFINHEKALKPLEDLRNIVENYNFEIFDTDGYRNSIKTTISIGLVDIPTAMQSDVFKENGIEKTLLLNADKAMYIAKEKKNSISVYTN